MTCDAMKRCQTPCPLPPPPSPPPTKQKIPVSEGDIDGDSMADELTATEFSISCGCSETPPPTAAPIRVLPVNGTCGEPLDEILVKSTFNPDLEGCYKETPSTMMDLPTYTVSGTNASEQIFMRAQQQDSSTSVSIPPSPTLVSGTASITNMLPTTRAFRPTNRWCEKQKLAA